MGAAAAGPVCRGAHSKETPIRKEKADSMTSTDINNSVVAIYKAHAEAEAATWACLPTAAISGRNTPRTRCCCASGSG